MRIIIIALSLLIATSCYAEVQLYRYTDKITGDEAGISYSDKDGNPMSNPNWIAEVITEDKKEHFIKEREKQIKAKQDAIDADLKSKRKGIKERLKSAGLTQQDVDLLVGESARDD